MFKNLVKVVLFIVVSVGLYAGGYGVAQKHLVSLSPDISSEGVDAQSVVEVVFDAPIKKKSVKQHTIVLKQGKHKVKGKTTLEGTNTLRFTPNEELGEGNYTVIVKKVKLKNDDVDTTLREPRTGYEKFIYWLCSLFYDNPKECSLYKSVCGNDVPKFIKTKKIKYKFSVDSNPKVQVLSVEINSVHIEEGNETTLSVTATLDDNTTQDVSADVEWIISKNGIVSVVDNTLKALHEGVISIQAKYKNITSDATTVTVYKKVNGYELPPKPDVAMNDSTLLGIDSNNNGVRDDVERYIIQTYNHSIEVGILMQSARAYNMVIVDPAKAQEVVVYSDNSLSCQFYWIHENNENFHLDRSQNAEMRKELKKVQFNTLQRHMAYKRYNAKFHGKVLTSPKASKEKCEFDDNGILGDLK